MSRPLSIVAAQNATQRGVARIHDPEPPAAGPEHQTLTREDIAKTLGLKDPSWFKQTADRGQGSAAFRKTQVEDSDTMDMSSVKAQLPGMSTAQRESVAGAGPTGLASPLPLNPPGFHAAADNPSDADFHSGRSSPARSASPTKGLGGFVQSAMMKRSDSIKRWSVTSPPGLSRVDSVSGNIVGRESARGSPRPRSKSTFRESATPEASRPASQSGIKDEASVSPNPSSHSGLSREPSELKIPTSPSKTMDSRRWSPTKSSWLENALNRPESPRPQHKSNPSQPDWMSDLARSKAASPTGECSRPSSPHKHQVSIGGLMRTTPFDGGAKTNTTGLGGIYSPPPGGNRPQFGHAVKPSFSLGSTERPQSNLDIESPQTPTPQEIKPEVRLETKPEIGLEVKPETIIAAKPELKPELKPEPQPEVVKRVFANSPPALKSKPDTPPKKDFRANLRQRSVESDAKPAQEPEFRNALGNLRRTKTQKYVAPDELKGNILRSKAALAVTEGPQKAERKDEFKDAILKKREDFKKSQAEGTGVTRLSTVTSPPSDLPEGLARRAELGKIGSVRGNNPLTGSSATAAKKSEPFKPVPGPKRVLSGNAPTSASRSPVTKSTVPEKPRRVSTEIQRKTSTGLSRRVPSMKKETSAPASLQQARPGVGKLADRFNPGLANMLARGPPPMSANGSQRSEEDKEAGSTAAAEPSVPGPQLTHMTKGRARGPRRKAPTSTAATKTVACSTTPSTPAAVQKLTEPTREPEQIQIVTAEPEEKPASQSVQEQVADRAAARSKPSPQRPWEAASSRTSGEPSQPPMTPLNKPLFGRAAATAATPPSSTRAGKENGLGKIQSREVKTTPNSKLTNSAEPKATKPTISPKPVQSPRFPSPPTAGSAPKPEILQKSVPSPRSVPSPKSAPSPKPTPVGTSSPASKSAQKPTTPLEKLSTERQFTTPTRAMPSRTFGTIVSGSPRPSLHGPRPQAESGRPKSRHGRPVSSAGLSSAASAPGSPMSSPTKQQGEVTTLLRDFFGPTRPRMDFTIDTAEVLMNPPEVGAKIQTQEVQMYRLSGDGKKTAVSTQNARVLFDSEMYICAHSYNNAAGKGTVELYFWIGDEVPDATAQDAHIFAQKEAKAIGGRLLKLYQGKESTEFMQALGGVIIVRRGSSDRFDSLAPHMLCGRRYLGQVAFDEVDMATGSLCAGFAFLISASGQCCLWKGKGSDVDELSAARLVGMELTLSGELLEVEEGREPASFWDLFEEGQSKPHSADHWRLKPNYGKYGTRLFCSDADARRQVRFLDSR